MIEWSPRANAHEVARPPGSGLPPRGARLIRGHFRRLGDLPDALPRFTVKATVEVTLEDGSKREYTKEVEVDVRDDGFKPENKS